MPIGVFYLKFLYQFISINRGPSWYSLLLSRFIEIPFLNANSVDPDLALHILPVSLLWDMGHKSFNHKTEILTVSLIQHPAYETGFASYLEEFVFRKI